MRTAYKVQHNSPTHSFTISEWWERSKISTDSQLGDFSTDLCAFQLFMHSTHQNTHKKKALLCVYHHHGKVR